MSRGRASSGMGVLGWIARRFLAAWLFAPLFAFWYVVFEFGLHLPPRAFGAGGATVNTAVIAALVAAFITDGMIVRRVKRAMKARKAPPPPPPSH
jgi:hypothetical protein